MYTISQCSRARKCLYAHKKKKQPTASRRKLNCSFSVYC